MLVSTEDTDAQGGWEARIVGTDSAHDLAVLKIDAPASALQPIKVCLLPCTCNQQNPRASAGLFALSSSLGVMLVLI